jgi:hypothetical protein
MPLKHVLSVMDIVNHSKTLKLWAIAHENSHKCKNVQTVIFFLNLHGNPKQWAIAHKNSPKRQKQRVFGHASQTCTECHGRCKPLQNPKTVGNSS